MSDYIMEICSNDMLQSKRSKQLKQISHNYKLLFSDMNACLVANLKTKRGDFLVEPDLPMYFDLTKCSEYDDFVSSNLCKSVNIKYNLSDTKYPYNKNYIIDWNKDSKEMNIRLVDQVCKFIH